MFRRYKEELSKKLKKYDNDIIFGNLNIIDKELYTVQKNYENYLETKSKKKNRDIDKILEYRKLISSLQTNGPQVLEKINLAGPDRVNKMVNVLIKSNKGKNIKVDEDFSKTIEELEDKRNKLLNNTEKLDLKNKIYILKTLKEAIEEEKKIEDEIDEITILELGGNLSLENENRLNNLKQKYRDVQEKIAMYKEAVEYGVSVGEKNLNKYSEYKKAKKKIDNFYNKINIHNKSNIVKEEEEKILLELNKAENLALRNKLNREKKRKKQQIQFEKNRIKKKIQEGEKLLSERLKKVILKRKQEETSNISSNKI